MNGLAVVTVSGKMMRSSVISLSETIAKRLNLVSIIVFDLSAVTHIDTWGLGELVHTHQAINAAGGKCCFVIKLEAVRRQVALTGIDNMIRICESIEEGFKIYGERI